MLRTLHSIPALIASLLLVLVALTGSVLSVFPAFERAGATSASGVDVATLAGRVSARLPGVETLVRQPSGTIVAYHMVGSEQRASVIDPASGEAVAAYRPSATQRWLKNLHRKLLLDDPGRVATGVGAAFMLFIVLSGLMLFARRMGGWKLLLGRVRGNTLQRLHNESARPALAGLVLSAATGLVMSLATFGLIPEGGDADPFLDLRPSGAARMALAQMAVLQSVDVSRLAQLKLASPDDPSDVIELETADGAGVVDPATGTWLAYRALDGWQRLHATVRMLHTGEGLWWLGLVLGASSLAVPLLAATGFLLWLRRRQSLPRLANNAPRRDADTLLLIGSETHTTWGFATALHAALTRAGLRVHAAPMNDIETPHDGVRRLLVLTATYGDGEAPESARQFLPRLARLAAGTGVAFAVLGFGDRQFPHFCGYAHQVHDALAATGLEALGETGTVDRQSEPEFRQWCKWLGETLGVALDIRYQPLLPRTTALELVSRIDYGADPQTLTAVLRFAPRGPARGWRTWLGLPRLPKFETGDLLGVVPPGGASPRYYSLVSAASDGVAEICVRRQPGGICSGYLTGLSPGAAIQAFVRPHESFRPAAGATPLILIGAGTGIGPLIGFIRHNSARRPMHLYFGARSAEDGFLYRDELDGFVDDCRLRTLTTAFSRSADRAYVQDRLLADAGRLRASIVQGAQVMVCGGRQMAEGVAHAWDRILEGSGLSVAQLRTQRRYVEDVY
ncbi:putative FAD/NAD(P)-binding oxidoreductase [Variovorax paradoxus B4]|uniref:NADPH--hemoprotein reductase n=1 Tax=Variovorax paradoxus B4 TaxID=1246301 RepID=T1XLP7_VARPD|nr:PepSY domain-containing protein [Variovorax paradoxus]AGU53209.1 putative FAD/NAD(P)-binding oxidoreductase [Variovorax paradoxus B4]